MASSQHIVIAAAGLSFFTTLVPAYNLNDEVSIGGLVSGAVQCQELAEGAGKPDACRGALPFRPHLSFRPTAQDTLYVELGFAAGNGLNRVSPFNLAPWGADLEDDVKDINGRGRNYLLTAWYRHEFLLGADNSLNVALGLIDSANFLDLNTFANDEYTQFMNEALVNSPQISLPSYDLGAAVEWDVGGLSLRAIYMNVGKEEEDDKPGKLTDRDLGEDYDYLGAEIGYSIRTALGEGNYRFAYSHTSRDFVDPTGTKAERRSEFTLSFDQRLGKAIGAFLRIGARSDKAAIDYDSFFAAGLDIRGWLWGREKDNVGLAGAYLNGGNKEIKSTRVAEAYYRFVIHEQFALSADLQYMKDDNKSGKDPEGFILGLRADAHF